jgi:pyruvate dehydrogenase E2 component (dihydrolipoamide acetyltransferase)
VEPITMPQLGETVTEGTITRWLKAVGDAVAEDEVLFEVSTDKVDTEVPSAHGGFLRAILVAEGDTVPIGTPLAVLTATPDEPVDQAALGEATPDGLTQSAGVPAEPTSTDWTAPRSSEPAPTAPGADPVLRLSTSAPGTTEPAPTRTGTAPSRSGAPDSSSRGGAAVGDAGFLSPVVRRLLVEYGVDAAQVAGTGDGGRITRADVLAAAANHAAASAPAARASSAAPAPTTPASPATPSTAATPKGGWAPYPPAAPGPDDRIVEFSRARRATAEHMVRSQRTSAHTLVGVSVDYYRLDPVRRQAGLSFLPFVIRAVVDALGEFPHLNASVGDDCLLVHPKVHLGVAVDVDFEALVVPVVKDAGALRLRAIHDAVVDLAARARTKRLSADDLSGGTFTITNVGQYGTVVTFPVINQPQVAILSTDGVRMTPVAVRLATDDWTVAVHPVGNLSLGFDHRAVDGAYAAAFLAKVRDLLETRDWSGEV